MVHIDINGYGFVRDPRFPEFTVFIMTIQQNSETWTIYRRLESFIILSEQLVRYMINLPLQFTHVVNLHSTSSESLNYIRMDLSSWLYQIIQYHNIADSQLLMEFLRTEANLPPPGLLRRYFSNSNTFGDMDMGDLFSSNEDFHENPIHDKYLPFTNEESDTTYNNNEISFQKNTNKDGLKNKNWISKTDDIKSIKDTKNDGLPLSVTLDDFSMIKVIGKGSFGKVILVRKHDSSNLYAMKVLRKENIIKRNQVEHTRTERHVLGYVRHPFVVGLNYAFQTSEKLYFVLDYCAGGELFFHLAKVQRFDEHRAKFYIAEITLAVEYIHQLDIIYRDLKPENVLLDANGHIKLTDFGLSKEGVQDNFSGAHSFCGTPEYLAPEILNRSGHGRAVDWWSLGALLYEMLTGLPPFYCRDRNRLFEKIRCGQLNYPKYLSIEATNLLQRLLEKDPTKRLGCGSDDAWEIKRHPFFIDIDWDLLAQGQVTPPWKPTFTNVLDTSQFDHEFTSMPLISPDNINQNRHTLKNKMIHSTNNNLNNTKIPSSFTSKFCNNTSKDPDHLFQGFTYTEDSYINNDILGSPSNAQ